MVPRYDKIQFGLIFNENNLLQKGPIAGNTLGGQIISIPIQAHHDCWNTTHFLAIFKQLS